MTSYITVQLGSIIAGGVFRSVCFAGTLQLRSRVNERVRRSGQTAGDRLEGNEMDNGPRGTRFEAGPGQ
jgi:hypothetical protein